MYRIIASALFCAFTATAPLASDAMSLGAAPDAGSAATRPANLKWPACFDDTKVTLPTTQQPVCGIHGKWVGGKLPTTYAYLGIRYGAAGRWQTASAPPPPPKLPLPIPTFDANHYGNICPQASPPAGSPPMSEDCLFLNVWTTKTVIGSQAKTPVLVFIHGGAFLSGQGSSPLFDGSALAAQKNVVVVTLNYRLGALGFLASDSTSGLATAGNFGLLDQQLALKWVYENISVFGGDNTHITIFGESAGAMSVGLHLFAVQGSSPYFGSAIMESNPMGTVYNEQANFYPTGDHFLADLCNDFSNGATCNASWYASLPYQDVVYEQGNAKPGAHFNPRALLWAPVVDGSVVAGQPVLGFGVGPQGPIAPKPYAFGFNHDEGVLFAAGGLGGGGLLPTPANYHNALILEFGWNVEGNVVQQSRYDISSGDYCYISGSSGSNPFCYYSPSGQSMANVLTDYSFVTGNYAAASAALASTNPQTVYGYVFAQAPIFNLYAMPADRGGCFPGNGNVCHGNELPYVFGNLDAVNLTVPAADAALSQQMMADWTSFAANPGSPGPDWTVFNPATPTLTLYQNTVQHNTALPWDANTAFWMQQVYDLQSRKTHEHR